MKVGDIDPTLNTTLHSLMPMVVVVAMLSDCGDGAFKMSVFW
jgi:hypothetical protein